MDQRGHPSAEPAAPVSEPRATGWATVVVVDDTPENVMLLERVLAKAGVARVRGFTDPVDAVVACEREPPDLVLLDLHMPELDAFGFMARLRAGVSSGTFLPVIVLTADISDEARRRALAAGAKDFLSKPFDITDVVLRVRNLLDTVALYRQLEQHNRVLRAEIEERSALQRAEAEELADREARISRLLISDAVAIRYQPIVDLVTGIVIGAEALARFDTDPPRPPNEWFAEAASVGRGVDLEVRAVELAVRRLDVLPPDVFLSINASPATVCSSDLLRVLGPWSSRVVIELTEHDRVDDYAPLLDALTNLRGLGIRLAVDDTGAGYASLQHILRLGADILKLDIALTRSIDQDPIRRSLASALVTFADDIGAEIIAEGVETAAELQTLQSLGVRLAQGYYLGRPEPLPLRAQAPWAMGSH